MSAAGFEAGDLEAQRYRLMALRKRRLGRRLTGYLDRQMPLHLACSIVPFAIPGDLHTIDR